MSVFVLLLAAAAAAPRFHVQSLAVEGEVASVVATDLDGDGRKDLLAVYRTGNPPYQKRSLNSTCSFEFVPIASSLIAVTLSGSKPAFA